MFNNNCANISGIKFSLLFEQFYLDKLKLKCISKNVLTTSINNNSEKNYDNNHILNASPNKSAAVPVINASDDTKTALDVQTNSENTIPGYINIVDISGRPVALEIESGIEPIDSTDTKCQKFYICLSCGKLLSNKANSIQHSYIHVKQKRFVCNDCDKKYYYKNSLNSHIRESHYVKPKSNNLEQPFHCERCKKSFQFKHYLDRHCKTVHPTTIRFSCNTCGKGFYYKKYFRIHLNQEMRKIVSLNMVIPKSNFSSSYNYFGNIN